MNVVVKIGLILSGALIMVVAIELLHELTLRLPGLGGAIIALLIIVIMTIDSWFYGRQIKARNRQIKDLEHEIEDLRCQIKEREDRR